MKLLLQHPTKNISITQGFGVERTAPDMLPKYQAIGLKGHNGFDYAAVEGTPVMAMHDGVVVYAGLDGSNGNLIVLKTNQMFDYNDSQCYFKTFYGHLQTGGFKVTAGDKVECGQIIALSGNTGMSFGGHLHMGVKPVRQGEDEWTWFNLEQNNGYNGAIDPTPYLPQVQEFTKSLKFGDRGDDIAKLQAFLIRTKYMPPVAELGFYGEITRKAVLDFQIKNIKLSLFEKNVLRGTLCGEKTIKKINEIYE